MTHAIKSTLRMSAAPAAIMAALGMLLPSSAGAQNYNWTGFYAGLHAGAAWGEGKLTSTASCPADDFGARTFGYFCSSSSPAWLPNGAAVGAAGTGSASTTGFNGGVQAGFNLQSGSFVYGVEGDIGTFGLKVTGSARAVYPNFGGATFTVGTQTDADWLGTLRGRLGWTSGSMLFYITGGLAFSDINVSNSFSDTDGATGASSASKLKAGLALGGGAEWAMNRNWTVKGEYLYVDLGSVSTTARINRGVGYSNGLTTKADINAHIGRVGVNYKF